MARTITGDDIKTGNPYLDVDGDAHLNGTTVYNESAVFDDGEGVIRGFVVITNLSVTIPTIADAENDFVEVTLGASATYSPILGDTVIASPTEALPTDCLYFGAYVSAADKITFTFGTKEGGAGVTGAAKTFDVLIFKTGTPA